MKWIVLVLVLGIVATLGSALFALMRQQPGQRERTVRSLTLRVGLSVSLFILLLLGQGLGWWQAHGVQP